MKKKTDLLTFITSAHNKGKFAASIFLSGKEINTGTLSYSEYFRCSPGGKRRVKNSYYFESEHQQNNWREFLSDVTEDDAALPVQGKDDDADSG